VPKKISKKSKNHNRSSVIHTSKAKPEVVYTVKNKVRIPKKISKRPKRHKSLKKYLNSKVSFRVASTLIILALVFAFSLLMWQGKKMIDAKNSAKNSMVETELSESTIKALNLIGNGDNYSNEIYNFNSAPESLKDFVIDDYRKTKAKCIVNGEFIGPVGYKIENVVNDNYAKILRICNGEEPLIVHYLSGKWVILHIGNGPVECSTVNDFSIPSGVLATCNTGIVQYTNPNP
jgi:hypothetical protein